MWSSRRSATPGFPRAVLGLGRQTVLGQIHQLGIGPAGVEPAEGVEQVARGPPCGGSRRCSGR